MSKPRGFGLSKEWMLTHFLHKTGSDKLCFLQNKQGSD